MAIAIVQSINKTNTSGSSVGSTFAQAFTGVQTAGNCNVVFVGITASAGTSSVSGVTDSANGAYDLVQTLVNAGNGTAVAVYVLSNIAAAGAGTNTVTVSFAGTGITILPSLEIVECSGVSLGDPIDKSTGATGGTTSVSTGNVTTGAANTLGLCFVYCQPPVNGATASGSGWTGVSGAIPDANGSWFEQQAIVSSGTVVAGTATATNTLGSQWEAVVVTLQPPSTSPTLAWAPIFPDRAMRPHVPVSEQQAFAIPAPLVFAWVDAIFPDSVTKPFLPTASHMAALSVPPKPERTSPLAAVSYPDRVDRPSLHASSQMATLSVPPNPERTSPLAATVFPDSVFRPAFRAVDQQAVTEISPVPERTKPIAVSVFPDRIDKPYLSIADQQAFVSTIRPERTSPLAAVSFPDSVFRPMFRAVDQLHVTELSPAPENTVALDWGPTYPDRATKLWLTTADQQAFVIPAPLVFAWVDALYPDTVTKLFLPVSSHMAAISIPPKVERTSPIAVTVFPDRVDKPYLPVSAHQAFALHPQPENTVALDWSPIYPDRVLKIWLPISSDEVSPVTAYDPPPGGIVGVVTVASTFGTYLTVAVTFAGTITIAGD